MCRPPGTFRRADGGDCVITGRAGRELVYTRVTPFQSEIASTRLLVVRRIAPGLRRGAIGRRPANLSYRFPLHTAPSVIPLERVVT